MGQVYQERKGQSKWHEENRKIYLLLCIYYMQVGSRRILYGEFCVRVSQNPEFPVTNPYWSVWIGE